MQTEAITAVIGLCITAAAAIGRAVVSLHGRQRRKHKRAQRIAALRAAIVADERSALVNDVCLSIARAIETSKTVAEIADKYTGSRYEHAFVRRLANECSTVAQFAGVMTATLHAFQTTLLCESERERCVHGCTSTAEFREHIARLHLSASTLTVSRHSMTVLESSPECVVRCGSQLMSSLDHRNEDENNIALALMRHWEASDISEPVRLWLSEPALDSRDGRGDATPAPRCREVSLEGAHTSNDTTRVRADPVYAYLLYPSDTAVTIALMRDPSLSDLPVTVFRRDWAFALLVDEEDTIVSATSTEKNTGCISGAIGQKSTSIICQFVGTLTRYPAHSAGTVLLASLHKVAGRVVGGHHERPRIELAKCRRMQRVISEPEDGGERAALG